MIAPPHQRELGHRHMAADAPAPFTVGPVVSVRWRVLDLILVAWQAGVISFPFFSKAIPPARCVTLDAVKLARGGAWAHPPTGQCVVFAQVPSVWIEVGILEGGQVEMIKEPALWRKPGSDGRRLCVTRATDVVPLHDRAPCQRNELQVIRAFARLRLPRHADMLSSGSMTGLAVDPGLFPGGAVAVTVRIVVVR